MDTGLHLCLHLPPGLPDTALAEALRRRHLFVETLSSLAWQDSSLNGIVLGYGGLPQTALEQGLRTIARTLAEA